MDTIKNDCQKLNIFDKLVCTLEMTRQIPSLTDEKEKMKCGCPNKKEGCDALATICNLGNFSSILMQYKFRTFKIINSGLME